MKIHHDKHHATYVGNINKATEGKDEVPILDLMADALEATPVRNSGGGHYNHGELRVLGFGSIGGLIDAAIFKLLRRLVWKFPNCGAKNASGSFVYYSKAFNGFFSKQDTFFNSNLLTIFFQHSCTAFFWDEMAPHDQAKKTKPSEKLAAMIDKSFGSFDEMKAEFEAKAAPGAVFGSGWVWLAVNLKGDEIKIVGTPNQDNPLMKGVCDEVMLPILGLDVWEHGKFLIFF